MNFNWEEFIKVEGKGYTPEVEQKDLIINKVALDLFGYSAMGFTAGLGLSIFFKRKLQFSIFSAGIGAGIAFQRHNQNIKWGCHQKCE